MAEQLSNKHGVRSSAQKEQRARNQYEETPASAPAAGAHGRVKPRRTSDKDAALKMHSRRVKRDQENTMRKP